MATRPPACTCSAFLHPIDRIKHRRVACIGHHLIPRLAYFRVTLELGAQGAGVSPTSATPAVPIKVGIVLGMRHSLAQWDTPGNLVRLAVCTYDPKAGVTTNAHTLRVCISRAKGPAIDYARLSVRCHRQCTASAARIPLCFAATLLCAMFRIEVGRQAAVCGFMAVYDN